MSAITEMVPRTTAEVYYPSSDGEPMAETGIHVNAIFLLREVLEELYKGRSDVFIGCDQYWYWEEGNPDARRSPDILVAFGVVPTERRRNSFFTWRENDSIPSFICEFPSEKTWKNDLNEKYELYERLGVKEYFVFDPEALHVDPPLQGWRLRSGKYKPIPIGPDGCLACNELKLRIQEEGMHLRLYDGESGQKILFKTERLLEAELLVEKAERLSEDRTRQLREAERLKKEAERASEDRARQLQEAERQKQEAERKAADQATEIARLKAELAALAKKPDGSAKP